MRRSLSTLKLAMLVTVALIVYFMLLANAQGQVPCSPATHNYVYGKTGVSCNDAGQVTPLAAAPSATPPAMQPWLTRSHDNQRTGWNSQETTITQTSLGTRGLTLKAVVPVYGDKRGVEAQPLIVPRVLTSTGVQDVMLLCSLANQCRGVNAQTGADIWDVTLGMPVQGPGNPSIDSHNINDHWGALSTGVVDPGDSRFYQVFWMSPDGSGRPQTARYYMAVLNVATGASIVPPVLITGTSQGYDFNAAMRKARASAVLLNQGGTSTVFQCTGTVSETGRGAAGFCFTFDTYTNTVTARHLQS